MKIIAAFLLGAAAGAGGAVPLTGDGGEPRRLGQRIELETSPKRRRKLAGLLATIRLLR